MRAAIKEVPQPFRPERNRVRPGDAYNVKALRVGLGDQRRLERGRA
jgi:hypothetical protein